MKLSTANEVAATLQSSGRTIRRHAVTNDIGTVIGSQRLFTASDISKLRKLVRTRPGNPLMGPNQPWRPKKQPE